MVLSTAAQIYSDDASLADWTRNYLRQHQGRLATDLDLVLKTLPKQCHVLDVGAAPFVTSAALQTLGFKVEAIDLEPDRFASVIAALRLKAHGCDIEKEALPLADQSVDAVLFNELFEHLRINPIFTLSEVFRVLKPGGHLLLSTPNLRSFRGIRNLILHDQGHAVSAGVYRQYAKLQSLGHMGHVREYTRRETVSFLKQIGFVSETIYFRGGYGRGLVGLAEKLAPSMRPFFSVIARRPEP
ncbi:MAG: class I SAM-dependent methyltransferase [Xanthomonadales bacterium]|nr:class I SAM-dependent methyltransferase [Xanthomonadales bacterium]